MSNINQSLNILLPTRNNDFSRELLDLSQSLLAQSRIRAPNLKAEEEIARAYACSEIACEKLSTKLRLPHLTGRPPCAPRIYKKLLGLLEQILDPTIKQTPTKSHRSNNTKKNGESPTTPTPSRRGKKQRVAGAETPSKTRVFAGKLGDGKSTKNSQRDAPDFVMPLIRQLCAAFSVKSLAPHVYTGVSTVLILADMITTSKDSHEETSMLTIALFFMALAKARDSVIDPESYVADSERALSIAGLEMDKRDQVDGWIERISDSGWSEDQEWWHNIPTNTIPTTMDPAYDSNEEDRDVATFARRRRKAIQEDEGREGILLPGLGTMLQEQNDWLSEERTLSFRKWKTDVIGRIKQIEKEQRKTVLAT